MVRIFGGHQAWQWFGKENWSIDILVWWIKLLLAWLSDGFGSQNPTTAGLKSPPKFYEYSKYINGHMFE